MASAVPSAVATETDTSSSSSSSTVAIVAVDGSQQAFQALSFYVDHLHRPTNTVVLMHCVEPLTMIGEMPSVGMYEEVLEESKDKSKKLEEKYMEILQKHKIGGRFVSVLTHRAGEGLVAGAKEEGAGLIVTGTRGLGTMRRTTLGSVSDYVLHHSHCPVVICPKTPPPPQ